MSLFPGVEYAVLLISKENTSKAKTKLSITHESIRHSQICKASEN